MRERLHDLAIALVIAAAMIYAIHYGMSLVISTQEPGYRRTR